MIAAAMPAGNDECRHTGDACRAASVRSVAPGEVPDKVRRCAAAGATVFHFYETVSFFPTAAGSLTALPARACFWPYSTRSNNRTFWNEKKKIRLVGAGLTDLANAILPNSSLSVRDPVKNPGARHATFQQCGRCNTAARARSLRCTYKVHG